MVARLRIAVAVGIAVLLSAGFTTGSATLGGHSPTALHAPLPSLTPLQPTSRSVGSAASSPATSDLTWSNLSLSQADSPPPRADANFVWDSTGGYGLLYGGSYDNPNCLCIQVFNDTWKFVGGVWTNVTPSSPVGSPSARQGAIMADDPADGQVILFGGERFVTVPSPRNVLLNDTWAWNGASWTNITPVNSPPVGFWASMTYDAATSSVILFGGENTTSQYSNDTWSFHAGVWTQLLPTVLPSARHGQEMVYDATDSEIVMFGGLNSTVYVNDTWTYGGGNWAPIAPGNHPGARVGAGLAYDSTAGTTLLYGGMPAPDDYYATWEFAAGLWTEFNVTGSPPNPTNPWQQMIYDPTDNYVVLVYEPDLTGAWMNTWTLTVSAASPPPTTLQVSLTADPSALTLGNHSTITTVASGGSGAYTYVYSTLPPGCTGSDVASFACIPTQVGNYVVGVNVTDDYSDHGSAVARLNVTGSPASTPPVGGSTSSSVPAWEWLLIVVVVAAVLVILFAVLRRQKKAPPAPPTYSPPPPPSPPAP
jgi:hypothetical protein